MPSFDEDKLAKNIGKAIARCRLASQLTQEEVAERLGIGNEAVSRIERGVVMPTIARLVELANVFQCDASELLTQASNRSNDQARHLNGLLDQLDNDDREMVINMVERLISRLANKD